MYTIIEQLLMDGAFELKLYAMLGAVTILLIMAVVVAVAYTFIYALPTLKQLKAYK